MAENSAIEWCTHTFNPWMGCQKVSAGCEHCYAETLMDTRYGKVQWGPKGVRQRTSAANWRKPYAWNRAAAASSEPVRVFCSSLADVFEDRPELVAWRRDLLALIESTPNLIWMLLTKRPENVSRMIGEAIGRTDLGDQMYSARVWLLRHCKVWIGTSVEDQRAADERIPHLLGIPAAVRFLSCEPLLGPIRLDRCALHIIENEVDNPGYVNAFNGMAWHPATCILPPVREGSRDGIQWVIVGGESGHGARPMHPQWARDLRDQCEAAGVPYFLKQVGAWTSTVEEWKQPDAWMHVDGRLVDEETAISSGQTWIGMHRVGKKAAGRLLDGELFNEMPRATTIAD